MSTGIDSKIYRLSDKIISRHVVAVRQGPHGNEKKKKHDAREENCFLDVLIADIVVVS